MSKKAIVRAKDNDSKRWAWVALASVVVLAVLWNFFGNGPRIPIPMEKMEKAVKDL